MVLLNHLVGEENDDHDLQHLPPMFFLRREHHVLAFTSEDVEHHVSGA